MRRRRGNIELVNEKWETPLLTSRYALQHKKACFKRLESKDLVKVVSLWCLKILKMAISATVASLVE